MSYWTSRLDKKIINLISYGAVGLLPTDTVYGISCSAFKPESIKRIYEIKNRDSRKNFVIISDFTGLGSLGITDSSLDLAKKLWPAKLTVVLEAKNAPDHLLTKKGTLAVRVPDSPELLTLLKKTGPLVSTSANVSGEEPFVTADKAKTKFAGKLDFYVDSGSLVGQASTIIKFEDKKPTIIRQGAIEL